jgi:DNA-binding LytR/AlgR family response regulator
MQIKTLIVDDEASARSRLRKLLGAHLDIELLGEASDGLAALAQIEQSRPDLIFLDVQMPGLSGFETLVAMPSSSVPLVIFATAYDQYALAAFEANAVSYLLKPISRERLAQAIARARQLLLSETRTADEQSRIRHTAQAAAPPLTQIVGRRRDHFVLLRLAQVCCFLMEDGIVKVKTEAESYWTDYQLNTLETRLPDPPFFRASRQAIVNLRQVKEIIPAAKSTFRLVLNDREASELHVSERQSQKLRHMLQG